MTTVNKEPGERILTLGKKGQTMELEVPLPPEHVHKLERDISNASAESFRLEAEMERKKEEVLKPIKDAIKGVKERERELVDQRNRGVMVARVPVETRANTFRKEKWVVRLDTGEEVPDTRRALSDEDLQTLLPGVVVDGDNRPDAPVLNLFAQRQELTTVTGEPTAPTIPWLHLLSSPYQDWSLSEVAGKDGARLYMVATGPVDNPSRAWGPFGYTWSEGFHPPGEPSGTLGDDVRASMAEALGLEAQYDVNEQGKAEPHETQAFEDFISALEAIADERVTALKAEALPPAPEGGLKLYGAGGHPGWAGYVHEGQFFLRPPNVDRFEPPRSPKDKGALEWDSVEERFDGAKGANVTSDWLTEHDRLLAEFDFLKKTGKITEPVNELAVAAGTTDALHDEDGVDVEPEADENEVTPDDASALSPGELVASSAGDGGPDVAALADKLTDNGRKLLKALATNGPSTSGRLGTITNCRKPGSALNHLEKNGLVERVTDTSVTDDEDRWDITDLGRKVYEQAAK